MNMDDYWATQRDIWEGILDGEPEPDAPPAPPRPPRRTRLDDMTAEESLAMMDAMLRESATPGTIHTTRHPDGTSTSELLVEQPDGTTRWEIVQPGHAAYEQVQDLFAWYARLAGQEGVR